MAELTGTNVGLGALRIEANDLAKASQWPELAALIPQLRADELFWPHWWAPLCAAAVRHSGVGDGRELLHEAIGLGYHQVEFHEQMLQEAFGADVDWPQLRTQITQNVPLAPIELHRWPTAPAAANLELFRLPVEREREFADRLPPVADTAWRTALDLLHWVAGLWSHGNDHVEHPDALDLLDRVAQGARFACVEYTIVLTQALNARGIPARKVQLFTPHHHAGLGRGHVVSEAWIDELGRWVLLDGQNEATWQDNDGRVLGVRELRAAAQDGTAVHLDTVHEMDEDERASWAWYFAASTSTGITWAPGPFGPVFQCGPLPTGRLVDDAAVLEPDLSTLWTEVAEQGDNSALLWHPSHPHAVSTVVLGLDSGPRELALDEAFALDLPVGQQELTVATRTKYDTLTPQPLVLLVR